MSCTLKVQQKPQRQASQPAHPQQVGTWLSLVERTLGVGEVASSNLVVPTIYFQQLRLSEITLRVHSWVQMGHTCFKLLVCSQLQAGSGQQSSSGRDVSGTLLSFRLRDA